MASRNEWKNLQDWVRHAPHRQVGAAVLIALTASACITLARFQERRQVPDRGLKFNHSIHADQGPLDCTICHQDATDTGFDFAMPDHNLCSVCHDIPSDALERTAETDLTGCTFCHTRQDYSVLPQSRRVSDEVVWGHAQHTAAGLECATCHADPDRPLRRPAGSLALMQFCMDCHEGAHQSLDDAEALRDMGACNVCHTVLDTTVRPTMRDGRPLPHDAPEIWERIHGREWQVSAEYCAVCHVSEEQCDACHTKTAPRNHTPHWRMKAHGLQATWDRQSCAVCHEEDSCVKCHSKTAPTSHRGAWGGHLNQHCTSCHFPAERNSCAVCHENIDHRQAMRSPHARGIFPSNCALCHPGGLAHRAPHPLNRTVGCTECHQ